MSAATPAGSGSVRLRASAGTGFTAPVWVAAAAAK